MAAIISFAIMFLVTFGLIHTAFQLRRGQLFCLALLIFEIALVCVYLIGGING